ncbi:hypothetical protein D9V41_14575 [Aeromicrobium phragmitis]|uniref:CobQ/CobB/MinD/ParA nucleotide binding domain-containing protein n=1 Tax=Aeromicrobium phragmitis TaxID=2478914 RepID=A0A3L8PHQ8_9ACTN|nr:hypothetical protein [Aeromicrobium phragmitis]RLV54815.1 hypothetical protein D9V41_14575 [Aeromicrobium phragmitis]
MIAVAVAAGGAGWEAGVLEEIERSPVLALARRCVDAADLLALRDTGRAQVAIVDPQLGGLDLDAVSRLREGGVAVVGLGRPEPDLGIVAAVRPGALDELAREGLHRSPEPAPSPRTASPVLAVWGPTGAPGRTSVAVELAASFARHARTVLVDADTHGGAVAQALGLLDEVSGLTAACRSANAGRPGDVDAAVTSVAPGFDVLTGLPRAEMWTQIRPAALHAVLDRIAATHELVVLDTGFGKEGAVGAGPARDQATIAALERADATVVVGRAEPLGLARLLRSLDDAGPWPAPPWVVVNHARSSLGWSDGEIAAMVREVSGHQVRAFLPSDAAAHDAAVVHGIPVREAVPTSPWVARIDRLARELWSDLGDRVASISTRK